MADIDYEDLVTGWSELLDALYDGLEGFDVDTVKKLIFATYHYYRSEMGNADKVSKKQMLVYKYVGQAGFFLETNYVKDVPESVSTSCADFLAGLCYVIEETFDAGYGANPLPIGLGRHTPAGGADPEADMTTYETFEKDFDDNVTLLREAFDLE